MTDIYWIAVTFIVGIFIIIIVALFLRKSESSGGTDGDGLNSEIKHLNEKINLLTIKLAESLSGISKEFNTTTMQLNMAYFSNYGATATTIMTSGQSVIVPKWDWTVGAGNTVYSLISGTSFASPIIAWEHTYSLSISPT